LFQTVWCSGKILDLYLKVPGLNPGQIIDYPVWDDGVLTSTSLKFRDGTTVTSWQFP
jgi:hypothetical protein